MGLGINLCMDVNLFHLFLKVIWRRVKGRMPVGRAAVLKGRGLRVSPLRLEDTGVYVCEASNKASSISANATLDVHSK